MVLPWSEFWERNYFAQHWPILRPFVNNSFVRGGVSGLGFINLLVGMADLAPIFSRRGGRFEPQADSRVEP
jgi:hypothetical protein